MGKNLVGLRPNQRLVWLCATSHPKNNILNQINPPKKKNPQNTFLMEKLPAMLAAFLAKAILLKGAILNLCALQGGGVGG